ncbi:phosphotransferase family enzyme [Paenibacillus cellulosilyticus]|uniref:Phosphotransferase family enzyme n=1 Tax=Paenibacillus cellulosilyticus TaxID=375489 RepID=A0A2V2YXE1_9BACL|nr:aminoglycoside phosphotransferase family protein [Paenibacillus cellulosilyticus]PWW02830.1 phosphotransferase family enzyme [Paenibacillus cellulosilyticus]QKS45749.1 aminoglycoside phosphotransferase family protein [Paenibacillus cellulosilyticus]
MKDVIVTRAEQIASDFLQEQVKTSYPIIDKGFANHVCVVQTTSHKVVVRMNDKGAYPTYMKEKWCIEQAAAVGVPGPEVITIGMSDDTAYMIQSFVEGENGLDSIAPRQHIWRQLGQYVRRIHSIPVQGYGENLIDTEQGEWSSPPHPGSDGSWLGYVQHNINKLTEDDPLIALSVLTPAESQQVRNLFIQIKNETFQFGLVHGDLSLKNTMTNQDGQVTLIDWGNAAVNAVPHWNLIHLMQHQWIENGLNNEEFKAFIDGYGIREEELVISRQLLLLKAFDNLRWAIDKRPDLIDTFAAYAKQAVQLNRDHGLFS